MNSILDIAIGTAYGVMGIQTVLFGIALGNTQMARARFEVPQGSSAISVGAIASYDAVNLILRNSSFSQGVPFQHSMKRAYFLIPLGALTAIAAFDRSIIRRGSLFRFRRLEFCRTYPILCARAGGVWQSQTASSTSTTIS